MLRWLWAADGAAAAQTAAELLARVVALRPESVLGLPTGRSLEPMYDRLADLCADGLVTFARATAFALDEYVGLAATDPCSYHAYMRDRFVRRVDAAPERVHVPRGDGPDPDGACRAYEAAIREAGGWELAILGVGRNGHIAFNEPGAVPHSRTRVVALSEATRQDNAGQFSPGAAVPTHALTVGVGTILEARSIVCVIAGAGKEAAAEALAAGRVDPAWPVTQLWRHADVTVIADTALRAAR